eukprot:gene12345-15522_t
MSDNRHGLGMHDGAITRIQPLHMCSNAAGPLTAADTPRHDLGMQHWSITRAIQTSVTMLQYAAGPLTACATTSPGLGCTTGASPCHPNSSHVCVSLRPLTACGQTSDALGMQHASITRPPNSSTVPYAAGPLTRHSDNRRHGLGCSMTYPDPSKLSQCSMLRYPLTACGHHLGNGSMGCSNSITLPSKLFTLAVCCGPLTACGQPTRQCLADAALEHSQTLPANNVHNVPLCWGPPNSMRTPGTRGLWMQQKHHPAIQHSSPVQCLLRAPSQQCETSGISASGCSIMLRGPLQHADNPLALAFGCSMKHPLCIPNSSTVAVCCRPPKSAAGQPRMALGLSNEAEHAITILTSARGAPKYTLRAPTAIADPACRSIICGPYECSALPPIFRMHMLPWPPNSCGQPRHGLGMQHGASEPCPSKLSHVSVGCGPPNSNADKPSAWPWDAATSITLTKLVTCSVAAAP